MTFELMEFLSLPGDAAKANEDAFAHDAAAAVVLDGATPLGDGLMPGPSDAAWIAHFGARRLLAHLKDGEGARRALRSALGDAQKSFEALRRMPPQEVWQTPCASMMLAVEAEGGVEFLWFGDCAALVKQGAAAVQVVGESFDKKAAEGARAGALAKERGQPATDRFQFLDALRAGRNRINSGDAWLFSPDPKAAAHVSRRVMKLAPGAHLLLASDGFLALATDYGAYSADGLMAAVLSKGLAALGEELRGIEDGDAEGVRFPRFKKSDDSTALLLRLS
ncbi:MAG TPA: protein phosphatase 2C domain-containing protein [Rhizomicrobium sp.]